MKNPNAQNQRQNASPSSSPSNSSPSFFSRVPGWLVGFILAIIAIAILVLNLSKSFWYFEVIENDQVGVKIEAVKFRVSCSRALPTISACSWT